MATQFGQRSADSYLYQATSLHIVYQTAGYARSLITKYKVTTALKMFTHSAV